MLYSSLDILKLIYIYGCFYRSDVAFFSHSNTLYHRTRFFYQGSHSPKQPFTKTNPKKHNLLLKPDRAPKTEKDPITFHISNEISSRGMKLYQKKNSDRDSVTNIYTKNRLRYSLKLKQILSQNPPKARSLSFIVKI